MKWQHWMAVAVCGAVLVPAAMAQAAGGQAPAAPAAGQAAPGDAVTTIKARVRGYYSAMRGGDRAAAEQFVVPESREQVKDIDLRTLAAFVVDSVELSPAGDTAVVITTQTYSAPMTITIPRKDDWKQVDGQWYLVLPKPTYETPFGVMKPSNAPPPDEETMRRITERRMQTADPDQYLKALEKFETQQRSAAQNPKPAEPAAQAQDPAKKCPPATSKKKAKGKKAADDACARTAQAQPASK